MLNFVSSLPSMWTLNWKISFTPRRHILCTQSKLFQTFCLTFIVFWYRPDMTYNVPYTSVSIAKFKHQCEPDLQGIQGNDSCEKLICFCQPLKPCKWLNDRSGQQYNRSPGETSEMLQAWIWADLHRASTGVMLLTLMESLIIYSCVRSNI